MTEDFQRHFTLNPCLHEQKLLSFKMFHWIILLVLIVYQDLFLTTLPGVFNRAWTLHAGVLKMPHVSNGFKDYSTLEVNWNELIIPRHFTTNLTSCVRFSNKYFFLLLWKAIYYQVVFSQELDSSHFSWHLFGGQKSEKAGRMGDFWKLNFQDLFESFCSKPIISQLHTTQEQIDLNEQSCRIVESSK